MSAASFAADWLRLRAPFDTAATERGDAGALARRFGETLRQKQQRGVLRLLDLGGGTGANVCRLAPRIPGSQHWTVVDSDPDLLAAMPDTIAAWARRIGGRFALRDGGVSMTTPQRIVTVTCSPFDLRERLAGLPLADADGVAGSALLDLVSAEWMTAAAGDLAARHLPALFTLNVDGRLEWRPAAADDADVAAAFCQDLIRDKGFGRALGHRAAAFAGAGLAARGYTVDAAPSDWAVGNDSPAMQQAMLGFIEPAASRHVPAGLTTSDWRRQVTAWAAAKRALLDAGTLDLTVGHIDLLATT